MRVPFPIAVTRVLVRLDPVFVGRVGKVEITEDRSCCRVILARPLRVPQLRLSRVDLLRDVVCVVISLS